MLWFKSICFVCVNVYRSSLQCLVMLGRFFGWTITKQQVSGMPKDTTLWLSRTWIVRETDYSTAAALFMLFVCFVALRPKSTDMVMSGRSVHLTALFPGQALNKRLTVLRAHTFACIWQQPFLNDSVEGRRMTLEMISWPISTKVWDWTKIKLVTPGSAVRHAFVARNVTDWATWPSIFSCCKKAKG